MRDACARVAAPGTDPRLLAAVLAELARPRRTASLLRRRALEVEADAPADRLRALLGAPARTDRDVADGLAREWLTRGVRVALVGDPAYPSRLAAGWPHTDGPVLLAWQGQPPDDAPSVAVVGARRASRYGTGVAAWVAEAVARAGGRVVSGGARGIDAAAHEAALEQPGGTAVVLGCGHGVAYPRPHAMPGGLFERILDEGGTLCSELLAYERPHAGNVRARNRVVAGLVDAVVVVEGGERSGALLTAGHAAERGTAVLAVPGDVRAPGSTAPHRLLAEGAAPCRGPADVLEALGTGDRGDGGPSTGEGSRPAALPGLSPELVGALREAWPRPVRVEQLAARAGRSVPALLAELTQARLAGTVAEDVEGVRLRRAPS